MSLEGLKLASTHPKINLSVWKYTDKEELGFRKRINTTVNSTYQSSLHVECTVSTNLANPLPRKFVWDPGIVSLPPPPRKLCCCRRFCCCCCCFSFCLASRPCCCCCCCCRNFCLLSCSRCICKSCSRDSLGEVELGREGERERERRR